MKYAQFMILRAHSNLLKGTMEPAAVVLPTSGLSDLFSEICHSQQATLNITYTVQLIQISFYNKLKVVLKIIDWIMKFQSSFTLLHSEIQIPINVGYENLR